MIAPDIAERNLVVRDLKYYRFQLDRDAKTVLILDKSTGNRVVLKSKVYLFSLLRALVSFGQKLTATPRKKKVDK